MSSMFASTRNTRAVIAGSYRYIRSDVPNKLTADEIRWLVDNNVTTIVDLRTESEREKKPVRMSAMSGFDYYPLSIEGADKIPERPELVPDSYMSMLNGRMAEILHTIEHAKSNVMYFCNAGKDRTGVVTALLLSRLGFERESIIEDYMLSAYNLKEQLEKVARTHDIDLEVITPHREYMERFLDMIKDSDWISA